MEFRTWLAQQLSEIGATPTELASETEGLNQPTVQRVLSGETASPGIKTTTKIIWAIDKARKKRGLSPLPYSDFLSLHQAQPSTLPIPPGDNRLPVRRALFKLSAGVSGYEVEYENGESRPIYMDKTWFESRGYRADKLIAVKVSGRSMEPSLHEDDLVVINTDDVVLKDGEVFAANFDGELVIKRLKRDAGQWYLSSDNQDKIRFSDKLCNEGCGLIGRIVYKQSERI